MNRAELVGVAHVGRRRDVARGALQVVGHRPVELVAQRLTHHVRHHRADAAELRVAEGILGAGFGEELAVGVFRALRDHHHAVAMVLHALLHARQEFLALEGDFGKQD